MTRCNCPDAGVPLYPCGQCGARGAAEGARVRTALRLWRESDPRVDSGLAFDAWNLAGPHMTRQRAAILSALTGAKVPVAKAGVTALRAAFYAVAQPAGECQAERDKAFNVWARRVIA